jgi:hypothetical protein
VSKRWADVPLSSQPVTCQLPVEPEIADMAEPEITAAEIFLAEAEINPPPRFETAELQITTGQAMSITP